VTSSTCGRVLLGLALAFFGLENLLLGGFVRELQPAPAWLPGALAYLNGGVLIAGGACLVGDRRTRTAARVLIGALVTWLVLCFAPLLAAAPRNGGGWTTCFEVIAIAGALALLGFPARPAVGRLAFAISLPVFGLLHFLYVDYVAYVIPSWIPAHRGWAYATGVFHLAGGGALLTGVRARIAAILLAIMFGSWVAILHLPRALAAGADHGEWTSLAVALAMCGGSLILVDRTRD
jgi:uncharacterized membrane protein